MARMTSKFGPARITVSKSGLGYSVGGGPLRVTKRADGGVQRTVRVPRIGIYNTKVIRLSKAGRSRGESGRVAPNPGVLKHSARPLRHQVGLQRNVLLLLVGGVWSAVMVVLLARGFLLGAILLGGLGALLMYRARVATAKHRDGKYG